MKKFIAYFDYLGYKQFIDNNELEFQLKIVRNNFRDMEGALSQGRTKDAARGVVADLAKSSINCINFSDTVVFWTNDDTEASLIELLEVAYRFNWQAVDFFFPARGALVYGEIIYNNFDQKSDAGGRYNINSVFGKGLVRAHEKANIQHWAGAVIDQSFIDELLCRDKDLETFLAPYAKKYKVPYKNGIDLPEEYVLRLVKGDALNDEAFRNYGKGIRDNFADYNKSITEKCVQEKIENTIAFLASFQKAGV